jgi:hypothetical protein
MRISHGTLFCQLSSDAEINAQGQLGETFHGKDRA